MNSTPKRQGRAMLKLKHWPIRIKIAALLVVPLLALSGWLIVSVVGAVNDAHTARDTRDLAHFIATSDDLVDRLQRERALSAAAIGAHRGPDADLTSMRQQVDQALAAFGPVARDLEPAGHDSDVRSHLDGASQALGGLRDTRGAVDDINAMPDRTEQFYTAAIAALLTVNGDIDPYASGPNTGARADGLVALDDAKEALAREGGFVAGTLAAGQYRPGDYRHLIQLVGDHDTELLVFRKAGAHDEGTLYDRMVTGPMVAQATDIQERLLAAGDGTDRLPVTVAQWWPAVSDRLDKVRATEKQLTAELVVATDGDVAAAGASIITTIAVTAAVLLVSVLVSLIIARSLVRPLRAMRGAALDTSHRVLPEMLARLQRGESISADGAPIPVLSRDEIGQVADSFNAVHQLAVRMATEEAATRRSVSDTFLNIARRSQALIHRQLRLIDDLERKAAGQSDLEDLFRLDHLATRMRRHAEDLIVLSGATPARGWRRPVSVFDVLRGAMAEVEDYTRIVVRTLDEAQVIGRTVGDVIHLLAELMENATSFSPPGTQVNVHGQAVANGYVIEIEDGGLGLDDQLRETLNSRLRDSGRFDVQATDRLGLFVVARLAQRNGINVHLRRSPYGGTTAIVLLPPDLLQTAGSDATPLELQDTATPPNGRPVIGAPPANPAGGAQRQFTEWTPAGPAELSPDQAGPMLPVAGQHAPPPAATVTTAPAVRPSVQPTPRHASAAAPIPAQPAAPIPAQPAAPDQAYVATDRPYRVPVDQPYPAPDTADPRPGPSPVPDRPWVVPNAATELGDRAGPRFGGFAGAGDWLGWFPETAGPAEFQLDDAAATRPADAHTAPGHTAPGHTAPEHAAPEHAGDDPPPGDAAGAAASAGVTENGLPLRTRQASIGSALLSGPGPRYAAAALPAEVRSPDEVRSLISSYQSGADRGRRDALHESAEAAAPRRHERHDIPRSEPQ
jgi:signal transduction histidine kinase